MTNAFSLSLPLFSRARSRNAARGTEKIMCVVSLYGVPCVDDLSERSESNKHESTHPSGHGGAQYGPKRAIWGIRFLWSCTSKFVFEKRGYLIGLIFEYIPDANLPRKMI